MEKVTRTPNATPSAPFTTGAAVALAPVASQVSGVRQEAAAGAVKLTDDAAKKLLDSLDHVRGVLSGLIADAAELEIPLSLGDNFIGRALSARLQGAATDGTGAALPVLDEFGKVLHDLELAVKSAQHLYRAKDDKAREDLHRIMDRFDMTDGVRR
ncbi:hypothetical protein [Amycolatopsis sp. H20-H5]|uniref:hypothetical protein n=1 Tax=Amycolatopsis sp. H20-H5 TaxID=3046309 RepID=UPI002DB8DD24|nr:hypothetical protein [Amycolatopsis sp. H20-H5]MEC3978870.1 hypothetical protein [Amycolatopsis sp. H20-H5]